MTSFYTKEFCRWELDDIVTFIQSEVYGEGRDIKEVEDHDIEDFFKNFINYTKDAFFADLVKSLDWPPAEEMDAQPFIERAYEFLRRKGNEWNDVAN